MEMMKGVCVIGRKEKERKTWRRKIRKGLEKKTTEEEDKKED